MSDIIKLAGFVEKAQGIEREGTSGYEGTIVIKVGELFRSHVGSINTKLLGKACEISFKQQE